MVGAFEKKSYFQLNCQRVRGFHGYVPMFHPHGELIYVSDGSLSLTVEGQSHTLQTGELAVVFPYLTHSYEHAPDAEVIIILFDPAATVFDNTLLSTRPTRCHCTGELFQAMLERAVILYKADRIKTAMSYLNAVLGELLEVLPLEERGDTSGVTAQLLAYCAEHYTENISVKTIAEALYISESYVSKVFSKKLGYGFREYINALRIEKVKTLLQNTNLSMAALMYECGFSNQSSFNRIFRDFCGMSPLQYRNSKREHKSDNAAAPE